MIFRHTYYIYLSLSHSLSPYLPPSLSIPLSPLSAPSLSIFLIRIHFALPLPQDNLDAVCARLGGRCWTLNSVMYVLLKELGYDVTPQLGSVAMEGDNNHMFNMVSGLQCYRK